LHDTNIGTVVSFSGQCSDLGNVKKREGRNEERKKIRRRKEQRISSENY
jgi:hypothetical protein